MAWLLMLGLASLGVVLARSGELVVFGLVIAAALLWAMADRTDPALLDPHPDADQRIVALGDSYISGEGSERFFPGTDAVGGDHNECRRASTAYSYRVAEDLGMGLDFLACSGARTIDILPAVAPEESTAGAMDVPADCEALLDLGAQSQLGQMPDSPVDIAGIYRQIYSLCQLPNRDRIAVALVSIGGNDAWFSEIAEGCFLPGTCAELRELWLGNVEALGPAIRDVYRSLRVALDGVPIVAMPYPIMLNPQPCGWARL